MPNPTTVNILLEAPVHGAEVDTWDQPVNRDWSAIDGLFGGVVTVGLTNVPVTLNTPTGTAAPAPGPFQAQNRVLRFTGALSGNVLVTLPLPTKYVIDNQTTGNFVVTLQAPGGGKIVSTQRGTVTSIYNDGTDCFFADLGKVGDMEFWAGLTSIPSWVSACTSRPYLLCDGSIYNFSTYPYLGPWLGASFGGNGVSTFGVPDMQGRVPLAYDGTGARITVGGAGFNGQVIGAAGGAQTINLAGAQNGIHNHTGVTISHQHATDVFSRLAATSAALSQNGTGASFSYLRGDTAVDIAGDSTGAAAPALTIDNSGSGSPHINVQPAQVVGIWVVKT